MSKLIGQNIKVARRSKRLNQVELSALCGWSGFPSRISNYERGVREPSSKDLLTMAKVLNVGIDWFYQDQSALAGGQQNTIGSFAAIKHVPLLAMNQVLAHLKGIRVEPKDMLPAINMEGTHAFALMVEGDSMESPYGDSLFNGCIVFVDPALEARAGDYVIAQSGEGLTLKQLVKDSNSSWLKPLNSRYPLMPFPPDGVVLGVVRSMMKYFYK